MQINKLYTNIFVQFPYIDYSNFTGKYVNQLLNMLEGSRLNNDMTFEGYGKIDFTDIQKQNVNVDMCFETFKTRNVTALVFDISKSKRNSTTFDKVAFFTQTLKKSTYIHYVFFNSETGKSLSHYYRTNDLMYLLQDLNTSFNRLENSKEIIKYGQVGDTLERYSNYDLHIITNGLFGI